MSTRPRVPTAFIFPVFAVFIWSVNLVVTRYAAELISPLSISFYRWLLAWFVLTPLALQSVYQHRVIVVRHLPKLAVLSGLGMVCYQGLAYRAAHDTTATNMGIINAFIPVFSLMLSVMILKVRPSMLNLIGTSISIVGLVYVISQGQFETLQSIGSSKGDALMVLAVVMYALYSVLLQRWRIDLSLLVMLYVQMCWAVLFHIPLLILFGLDRPSGAALFPIAYAGIFASMIAPFVWMKAIQLLGANRSSIFMNLIPIITAFIAALFLHEHWTTAHTIGSVLVFTGIMLAQRR